MVAVCNGAVVLVLVPVRCHLWRHARFMCHALHARLVCVCPVLVDHRWRQAVVCKVLLNGDALRVGDRHWNVWTTNTWVMDKFTCAGVCTSAEPAGVFDVDLRAQSDADRKSVV